MPVPGTVVAVVVFGADVAPLVPLIVPVTVSVVGLFSLVRPIASLESELNIVPLSPVIRQKRKTELKANSRHRERICFTLIFLF